MSAENLSKNGNSEGKCLHRDKVPWIQLEEEKKGRIKERDDKFFMNMDAIETIFSERLFEADSVTGNWIVDRDNLYTS